MTNEQTKANPNCNLALEKTMCCRCLRVREQQPSQIDGYGGSHSSVPMQHPFICASHRDKCKDFAYRRMIACVVFQDKVTAAKTAKKLEYSV